MEEWRERKCERRLERRTERKRERKTERRREESDEIEYLTRVRAERARTHSCIHIFDISERFAVAPLRDDSGLH